MHRASLDEPGVAINAGAFIPPALHVLGVHPDGNRVHVVAVSRHRCDINVERSITAEVVADRRSIEIHRAMRRHAIELQLDVFAMIGGIQFEGPPIPPDAARTVAFLLFRFRIERLFHRPIMRQVDQAPALVIIPAGRRAPGVPCLGVVIRQIRTVWRDALAARKRFQGNVSKMKTPTLIQGKGFPQNRGICPGSLAIGNGTGGEREVLGRRLGGGQLRDEQDGARAGAKNAKQWIKRQVHAFQKFSIIQSLQKQWHRHLACAFQKLAGKTPTLTQVADPRSFRRSQLADTAAAGPQS